MLRGQILHNEKDLDPTRRLGRFRPRPHRHRGDGRRPEGRITPGDLGLYSDDGEAGLNRLIGILKSLGQSRIAIQLGQSGRGGNISHRLQGRRRRLCLCILGRIGRRRQGPGRTRLPGGLGRTRPPRNRLGHPCRRHDRRSTAGGVGGGLGAGRHGGIRPSVPRRSALGSARRRYLGRTGALPAAVRASPAQALARRRDQARICARGGSFLGEPRRRSVRPEMRQQAFAPN